MKHIFFFLLSIALGLCIPSCTTSPTGRSQLLLVSPEQAIFASRQAYTQTLAPLQKDGKLDSNPGQVARVKLITGKVVAQAIKLYPQTSNWDWQVKVIDDPETVNAWCMAGGKMAIYTGLLNKVKPTDDELAQVMGHEIAHAVANHTAERMSVAMATQVGIMAAAIAAKDSRYKDLALSGMSLAAVYALQLPNSRTSEAEADRIGIELAARAGYDPNAAATLWEKMARVGGSTPPEFMSTHPDPANRQRTLRGLAPEMMPYYNERGERPVHPVN